MSPNHKRARAQCCAGCKTVTLTASMVVWESEGEPGRFDGRLVCESCESALVADEHDDPACHCRHCQRARELRLYVVRQREAATYGGLRSESLALLGLSILLTDLGLSVEGKE